VPEDVPTHMKMRIQNYSHTHIQFQAEGGHTKTPGSSVEGIVPKLRRALADRKTAVSTIDAHDPRASQVWNNALYKEFLFFII